MGDVVIVTQVHRTAFRTPEVGRQVGRRVCGAVHLQRGGVALPEVLDAHAEASADVACEGVAVGTLAGVCPYPHILLMGTLLHGIALVGQLAEAVGVPLRPVMKQVLSFRVESLWLRDAEADNLHLFEGGISGGKTAGHTACRLLATAFIGRTACQQLATALAVAEDAAAVQGLHALCPYASVVGGKGYVAVVGLLAHRHFEADTQRTDEIAVLVAVIYKGMHEAHLLRAGIEIEANGEWQPLGRRLVLTGACKR